MTDDELRALADQLEAHAANYVHAHATERLLRQAAAALTALMAERDEVLKAMSRLELSVTDMTKQARRAAFARAREFAEEWEAFVYDEAESLTGNLVAREIAAAIEAEMGSETEEKT